MDFRPIARADRAFQQPISSDELLAMCGRAFGAGTTVLSAVEIDGGFYNNTYMVDIGAEHPMVLRVAPSQRRQTRIESELLRNAYAIMPFFSSFSDMMPRIVFADWTGDISERDYIWQTYLEGTPAHEGLNAYPRDQWPVFFEQLGNISRRMHEVAGPWFGRVAGPHYSNWSEFVLTWLEDAVADLEDAGLPHADVRGVLEAAEGHSDILDEITSPRLLHGDLWVPNVMMTPGAPLPTISGFLDHDRALFGDPVADWAIFMAERRPGTERDAFWNTYGRLSSEPNARWRRLVYWALHLSALRLERHRLGLQANPDDDGALLRILGDLTPP
ncbi:MAG: aminoglycoside phosphotransferase family protein [Firmicutes bacterium]|nr:aminoglycoside phosphotransferase family protein [Bacillota bacterium]